MSAEVASTPATASRRGGRRIGIGVAIVIGALVALTLIAGGVDHAIGGSEPSGVAGSSYGTQPTGLGAFAALLTHYGHAVTRDRGSLVDAGLDPAGTVFVIEPQSLTDTEESALIEYADAGGRLVIGGSAPFYLHRLRDDPPQWSPDGSATYGNVDPSLGTVRAVDTAGNGAWTSPGSGVVVASSGSGGLLTEDRVGRGAILFLADASPLENAYLDRADDAAFALGLAGDGRPVEFAEGVHGYGQTRGIGAIPTPWKVALVVLAGAALVLAWSRSRRFGPPDRPARELLPARGEYVRALAVSLERTRDPEHALASVQQWARARVAQQAHLRPDASLEEIDRAALRLGYSEPERAAIWHPTTDDDTAITLGRLVARLSQQDGRTT